MSSEYLNHSSIIWVIFVDVVAVMIKVSFIFLWNVILVIDIDCFIYDIGVAEKHEYTPIATSEPVRQQAERTNEKSSNNFQTILDNAAR